MESDCALGNIQPVRNLLVGVSFRHQADDLLLALAQCDVYPFDFAKAATLGLPG